MLQLFIVDLYLYKKSAIVVYEIYSCGILLTFEEYIFLNGGQ